MIRKILAVAEKEFRHVAHDPLSLGLIFGLPVFQLVLFGYALDTRVQQVPAIIVNHDSHQAGRLLEQRISESSMFSAQRVDWPASTIESALRTGAIRVAIEIPSDYTSNLLYQRKTGIRVWIDGTDVETSNYILAALDAVSFEEITQRTQAQMSALHLGSRFEIEPTVLFNRTGRTAGFVIPGLIAILVQMITTLLVALSIAKEREAGTMEQLLVMRLGTGAILGGKSLAYGCIGLIEAGALVLLMRWLFRVPIEGSILLLVLALPLLVLAPVGIGLLIASRSQNQSQALQLTYLIFLPSVLLSGFLLPREFLRFPMDWAGNLLPTTYLVDLVRSIISRGVAPVEAIPKIAVVFVFGVALSALGSYAMRKSMQ